jgi:hypothetical protein
MRKLRYGLAASVAVAAATLSPAPASAAAPGTPPDTEQHCTASLDTGAVNCFDSYADALAPLERPASGERTPNSARDGQVIVGTFYTETGYGGSTFTVYGGSPCVGDGKANWFMGSFPEWAHGTRSLQTWADCGIYVYSEENYAGTKDGRFDGNVPDIGSLVGGNVKSATFH